MHYIEINETIFDKIVGRRESALCRIDFLEGATKRHFFVDDARLMLVENYIPTTTRYYIADFNS